MKATCPGVVVNWGVAVRVQAERAVRAGQRGQEAAEDPVALDRAAVQRVEHVDQVAVGGHVDRDVPPERSTSRSASWSPRTAKTEIVSLPAFTA